jgi:hypothetical protein
LTLIGLTSLGILIAAFVFQLSARSADTRINTDKKRINTDLRIYKILFLFAVAAVIFYYLYLVYAQYLAWREGGITKFLVPPHESVFYVFGYHFTRFVLYYLASLGAALLFFWAANYFNRKHNLRFFENEEPYLGALSIFLLGNPAWNHAWIYYVVALLVVAVILSLVKSHWSKRSERLSLRFLWLPLAILVVLVRAVI